MKPKEKKIKWVKQNSKLHKQLEDAHFVGYKEGQRDLITFLVNEGGFSEQWIGWLVEERFTENKDIYD